MLPSAAASGEIFSCLGAWQSARLAVPLRNYLTFLHFDCALLTPQTKKCLKPSPESIGEMPLQEGYNQIVFIVNSKILGRHQIEGELYLFSYKTKIVVSDIDGTVTKSDFLGQFFTMVSVQWVHDHICQCYTEIKNNGYQFIYITSRPIAQYEFTKKFLRNQNQNKFTLPQGTRPKPFFISV